MGFDTGGFAGGGSGGGGGGGGSSALFGAYRSALIDFKTAAVVPCNLPVVVPSGEVFYPDEVGIVVVSFVGAGGAFVQPTVSWGINGNTAKYKAASLMSSLTAANMRDWFNSLVSAEGIPFGTTPTAEITVPASDITTFTGYIYFNGVNLP